MGNLRLLRYLESASLLLFFLQALRTILSVLFGIIYDQVLLGPINAWFFTSLVLVVTAFCAPALTPAKPRRIWPVACVTLIGLARIGISINDAQVRYFAALIVLAFGGLYLAWLISNDRQAALTGLLAALVLDQIFRATGQTYDLTLRASWLAVQFVWAAGLIGLAFWLSRHDSSDQSGYGVPGLLWGLGIGSMFFLETSLLALPNAVARWSGVSYAVLAPLLLLITCLPLFPGLRQMLVERRSPSPALRLALAILLAASLLLGYFIQGLLSTIALLVAQGIVLTGLVGLLNGSSTPSKRPGPRLALGMIFFFLLNLLNAFAFTYPYVLPVMRGLGWAVYLLAVLVFGLAWIRQPTAPPHASSPYGRVWPALVGAGGAVAMVILSVWPRPVDPLPTDGSLRAGTYNIHYGYDAYWHLTLDAIARTIAESGADIVALQEVDTGRLTSYAVDDAYYLARRLHMNVTYLPTVEHLTGIALLYRGTAESIDSHLLTSLQEQTGIVHAHFNTGGQPLDAYGIWMGLSNEDTLHQINEALNFIGTNSPATFGGDFNAEPDNPVVQAVLQAGFADPFKDLGIDPPPPTAPAIDPQVRIDYVFTRHLNAISAEVLPSLASDHRMVVVEMGYEQP